MRSRRLSEAGSIVSIESCGYRLTPLGVRLIPAIEAIVDVGQELKRLRAVR